VIGSVPVGFSCAASADQSQVDSTAAVLVIIFTFTSRNCGLSGKSGKIICNFMVFSQSLSIFAFSSSVAKSTLAHFGKLANQSSNLYALHFSNVIKSDTGLIELCHASTSLSPANLFSLITSSALLSLSIYLSIFVRNASTQSNVA
jgi:hypothetical protein